MAKKHAYYRRLEHAEAPSDSIQIVFESGTLVFETDQDLDGLTPEIVFDPRIQRFRAPAIEYRLALKELLRRGHPVLDLARDYEELELQWSEEFSPYPHQSEAIDAWKEAGRRGLVVLPTGAGKSFVARMAIANVARNCLIVAPTLDLVNQWVGGLEQAFGTNIGTMAGGVHDPQEITVATYDSAAIHVDRLGGGFGLVIFDETHHLPSPIYRQIAEASIAPFRLGLTATPDRADGGHDDLKYLVGNTVYRRGIKDLSGDILADYEVRTIGVAMDEEDTARYTQNREVYRNFVQAHGIRMGGRNGWRDFLATSSRSENGRRAFAAYRLQKQIALGHSAKVAKVLELLGEHIGSRTIVFANDNATVYRIAERALVPALTHHTPIKERKEILDRFRVGEYDTIVTSRVLNEGVDVPEANVAIVLSGTGSVREHVQRLGRILRKSAGKKAVLYELVTENSIETFVSERRREHDAYK